MSAVWKNLIPRKSLRTLFPRKKFRAPSQVSAALESSMQGNSRLIEVFRFLLYNSIVAIETLDRKRSLVMKFITIAMTIGRFVSGEGHTTTNHVTQIIFVAIVIMFYSPFTIICPLSFYIFHTFL